MSNLSSSTKTQTKSCGPSNPKKEPTTSLSLEYRPRTFYVFFTDVEHWCSQYLKDGFSHCYAIEEQEHVYMMYDPTRNGLNIYMPPCSTEHPLIENMKLLNPALTIIQVVTLQNENVVVLRPKALTCVSTLEYVLGINFGMFGALTPYKFYKALLDKKHPNILEARQL